MQVSIRTLGFFFSLVLGVSALLRAQERIAIINANVIDPARGAMRVTTVVIADGKIESLSSAAPPAGARVIDIEGRYLLPGLIDTHVHISSLGAARRAMASGVTTARSMGVSNYADVGLRELAKVRNDLPEILAAGYHVRPRPAERLFVNNPELADLMDAGIRGPEAVRRMAGVLLSHGVDFLKATSTDRAGLPTSDPRRPIYSEAEMRALVEVGTAAGIPVAVHAHGDEGARAAVAAGARSIEHGTYMSAATLDLMVERGTYLVPTLAVVEDLTLPGGDYDSPVLEIRGKHMLPRIKQMASRAHARGIPIAAATDTGYGPNSVLRMSHELLQLVDIGMSPLEAIRAGTTTAAKLLGVEGHTGRIAEGLDADLIVLESNPLDDIGVFQDVLMVISDGYVLVNRIEW